VVGVLVGAGVTAPYLWDRDRYGLLDHVDLAVHEAGHVVFAPFGEFAGIAGGTLLQLIVPLAFVGYFALRGERFAAFIVLFWFSQSLFNVARYAADARAQLLPLVGGEYVIHDWSWMLSRLRLLRHDRTIADLIRAGAAVIWFAALAGGLFSAGRETMRADRDAVNAVA
jgi:hypothetical protein